MSKEIMIGAVAMMLARISPSGNNSATPQLLQGDQNVFTRKLFGSFKQGTMVLNS